MNDEHPYNWTVMMYLAGNNSLSEDCVHSLTQMANANIGDKIAVIARLNTSVHEGTILKIEKGTTVRDIHNQLNDALTRQHNTHSGSSRTQQGHKEKIRKFVGDCIGEYRAKHYMLILSGHGAGVQGMLREDPHEDWEFTATKLDDLIEVISDDYLGGERIDILGLDSCLMSMTEIAYGLHNHVKVMIGAEGYEPRAGWPYAKVLERISSNNGDVYSLAKAIVADYVKHYEVYQAANVSVDQSACDLAGSVPLVEAIKSLAVALSKKLDVQQEFDEGVRDAVILSHWEAQLYKNEQYTDLYDFCSLLEKRLSRFNSGDQSDIRRACQNVLDATAGFVLQSCYSGWAVQYSYGVSIYFPWSEIYADMENYRKLRFARDSQWANFLDVYLDATKREPRGMVEPKRFRQDFLTVPVTVLPANGVSLPYRSGSPNRHAESNRNASPNRTAESNRHGEPNRNGESNRNGEPNRNAEPNKNADPNKNSDPNKGLRNSVGSMKNPPTRFVQCRWDTDD